MAKQKISVKWQNNGEFRRFAIEFSAKEEAYSALWTKLHALEPTFNGRIGWKDADGDMIVIASECEMQEAIGQANLLAGSALRLHTVGETPMSTPASTPQVMTGMQFDMPPTPKAPESKTTTPRGEAVHAGVECDECMCNPIVGARYKCLVCADYDLCSACHDDKRHEQHAMIRIADINDHSWRSVFHHRRGPRGFDGPKFGGPNMCGPQTGPCGGRGPRWGSGRNGGRRGPPSKSHSFDHLGAMMTNMSEHFNQHANSTGENVNDYLKTVGKAVSDALGNMGIAVDVDVEDNDGKRQKVDGETPLIQVETNTTTTTTTTEPTEGATAPVTNDTPAAPTTPEVQIFDGGQWQFVEKTQEKTNTEESTPVVAEGKLYPSVEPSAPPPTAMETEPSTSGASKVQAAKSMCLAHLLNMGFTNENGWLEAIVEAKHGDLNAVLSALQRK